MNTTLIAWKEMKASVTNITLGDKIETYLFNTTKWISYDLAPDIRYCYGVGLDVWGYV